jgi:outer membrane biosynthesis protein TonB
MSGDDSKKIVGFPVPPEECARRLKTEVDRLAAMSVVEWRYYLESTGVAEKHGVSRDILQEMIEATIKANEKKAREDKAEDQQRERRVEKKNEKEEKQRTSELERKSRKETEEEEREPLLITSTDPISGKSTLARVIARTVPTPEEGGAADTGQHFSHYC